MSKNDDKTYQKIFDKLRKKPFLEQWLRINRFLELVRLIEQGEIKDNRINQYKFDLYATFFVLCYHFRDWLVNSKTVKSHIVDHFVQNSYELGLCRNLCLGVKHYTVTKPSPPQVADFSSTVGIKIPIVREYSHFDNKERMSVLADGKNYNALELATKCVDQWRQFLKLHKLLS